MNDKKKEHDEEMAWNYNEGRLNADRKWIEAIDERIAELEKQVGIPELRRLKEKTKYSWKNDNTDPERDDKKIAFIRSSRVRRRPTKGVKKGRPYLRPPKPKKGMKA